MVIVKAVSLALAFSAWTAICILLDELLAVPGEAERHAAGEAMERARRSLH